MSRRIGERVFVSLKRRRPTAFISASKSLQIVATEGIDSLDLAHENIFLSYAILDPVI